MYAHIMSSFACIFLLVATMGCRCSTQHRVNELDWRYEKYTAGIEEMHSRWGLDFDCAVA